MSSAIRLQKYPGKRRLHSSQCFSCRFRKLSHCSRSKWHNQWPWCQCSRCNRQWDRESHSKSHRQPHRGFRVCQLCRVCHNKCSLECSWLSLTLCQSVWACCRWLCPRPLELRWRDWMGTEAWASTYLSINKLTWTSYIKLLQLQIIDACRCLMHFSAPFRSFSI